MTGLTTAELNVMSPSEKDKKVREAIDVGASPEDIKKIGRGAYVESVDRATKAQADFSYEGFFDYDLDAPIARKGQESGMPKELAEKESFQHAMSQPNPSLDKVREISSDLQKAGFNTEIEEEKTTLAELNNDTIQDVHVQAVANGRATPEEARDSLAGTPVQTADDISTFERFYAMNLTRAMAPTEAAQADQDQKLAELIQDDFTADVAIAQRVADYQGALSTSFLELAGGAILDVIPVVTQISMVSAINSVLGESVESAGDLFRGQYTKNIRKKLEEMPPDLRYLVSVDIMEAIQESSGFLSMADYQRQQVLLSLFNPEYGLLDESIDNAISILDALSLGWTARALWTSTKVGFKPGSNLDTLNMANPDAAAKAAAAGIKTDAEDVLQMTPEEIIETAVLPSPLGKDFYNYPADITKYLDEADDIVDNIEARTLSNPLALLPEEQDLASKVIRKQLQTINNNGLYDSNIAVKSTENSVQFTAKYGYRTAEGVVIPFGTRKEALENALRQFPDAKGIKIFSVTKTKGLRPVPKNKFEDTRKGQYIYEVQGEKSAVDIQVGANKLFLNDGDVVRSGTMKKWFFDPASRFAKWISQGYDQAGDWGKGIATELATLAKPFESLKTAKQRHVVRMLQDYAKDPSWDTLRLVSEAGDDMDVVKGFLSLRKSFDALYTLENREFRKSLRDQGGKYLFIDDFQGVAFPKSPEAMLREIDLGRLTEVYDPRTGKNINLNAKELQKLVDNNYSFHKLLEPHGKLRSKTEYVVAKADDIAELPSHVLKKIDGYIPRYYKDTYFVRATVRGVVNGVRQNNIDEVLSALPNRADALKKIDDLKKENRYKDMDFEVVHDRSLNPQERASMNVQDSVLLQRMFYHKRGTHLQGIDGLSEVSDPIEALIKNIDSTARSVSHSDLNRSMKDRWVNTFGKKYGLVDPAKGFPMTKEEIGATRSGVDKQKENAIELWEHIRASEGMMTKDQELWKNSWVKLADWIQGNDMSGTLLGTVKKPLAQMAVWLSNNSVNKMLRTLAFQHLIGLNPFRQFYIQSQQWLFISALAPKAVPKVIIQNKAVMVGLIKDATPELYKALKNTSAKAMGMSTAEYENFIKKFKETGIPHSVDSHDFVRDNMVEFSKNIQGNVVTDGLRQIGNLAKAPFKLSKDVGFNYGELSNLVNTFLLARIKYLEKTGKKQLTSQRDFAQVAADARSFALSMTKSGSFAYQEGLFSAFTQFLSIQHKALLALYGGNKAFTGAERARILLGQFTLNGATGLGLYEMYRGVRDYHDMAVPDEFEPFVVGGLYEMAVNGLVSVVSGEDSNANFSDSLSPAAGVNQSLVDYYEVMLGNKPAMEIMASSNVINRYTDAARTLKTLYEYPDLGDENQLLEFVSVFGTVTSGWNQTLRGYAAYRLGAHVSSSGSPTVQATFSSAMLEGVYGIAPRGMDEFYELQKQFGSGTKRENSLLGDPEKEAQTVADHLYRSIQKVSALHIDEFDANINPDQPALYQLHEQKLHEALRMRTQIMALYEPIERERIWQLLAQKVQQDRVQGRETLVESIIKAVQVGDVSDPDQVQAIINRLQRSKLIDPNSPRGAQQIRVLRFLMKDLTSRRGLSDLLQEVEF